MKYKGITTHTRATLCHDVAHVYCCGCYRKHERIVGKVASWRHEGNKCIRRLLKKYK